MMTKLPKHEKSSGNIFADLKLENADKLLREAEIVAEIVAEIARLMKQKKLTQAKAAALTGTAQPDLFNWPAAVHGTGSRPNLLRGFSIERLMLMLTAWWCEGQETS
jgi:predicted XRE-type DNA-binding protein